MFYAKKEEKEDGIGETKLPSTVLPKHLTNKSDTMLQQKPTVISKVFVSMKN